MASEKTKEIMRKLIFANHILHKHGAVDGYGFIGVRHPENPSTFLISAYGPPALVESASDIIEYHVDTSQPLDPSAGKGYSERFIVGEILKRFPAVQSVVHSHAPEVLPYCCTTTPLQAVFHMGGFLGQSVPVWDIRECYDNNTNTHRQDMLVNTNDLGSSLAKAFSKDLTATPSPTSLPDHQVVLQTRHGFATHGPDIETAVFRTLYTRLNAKIQTDSILLQTAAGESVHQADPFSPRTVQGCAEMNAATQDKAWKLWVREVKIDSLYRNRMDLEN